MVEYDLSVTTETDKNVKRRKWLMTFWHEPKTWNQEKCRYFVYCKETAPTTGKIHWQAYAEMFEHRRFTELFNIFHMKPGDMWIGQANGTAEDNLKYCFKTRERDVEPNPVEDRFEWGTPSKGQGDRTDIRGMKRNLDIGAMTMDDIKAEQPQLYCQYRNGWREFEKDRQRKVAMEMTAEAELVIIICESLAAMRRRCKNKNWFLVPKSGMFDEYRGQDTIVLFPWSQGYNEDNSRWTVPTSEELPARHTTTYFGWTKVLKMGLQEAQPRSAGEGNIIPLQYTSGPGYPGV